MYPYRLIIERARYGRRAVYPRFSDTTRLSIMGADITQSPTKFPTLEDILLVPPQFTPLRLEKAIDLLVREPVFFDVDLSCHIGGFYTSIPLVQSSMGSPDVWNRLAPYAAEACAREGIIYGIGENVAATWGYDDRKDPQQPSLKERIIRYFENFHGRGGIVIQQNEEDASNELWNRIYSDPDLDRFFKEGLIAFEVKAGQGAKAGMGGEKIVDREKALEMRDTYYIHPDPLQVERETYERHSAPDIFTVEILKNRLLKLKNDYPRAKIWLKTGPYRDLETVLQIAETTAIDCVTIDGKEGGTGMSPSVALQHLGLPAIICAAIARKFKQRKRKTSIIISGRMTNGGDLLKIRALGLDGIAMGRPFLIAGYSFRFAEHYIGREVYKSKILGKLAMKLRKPSKKSVQLIRNFIETIKIETQLLASALGKYSIQNVSDEDIISIDNHLGALLGIESIFDLGKQIDPKHLLAIQ